MIEIVPIECSFQDQLNLSSRALTFLVQIQAT